MKKNLKNIFKKNNTSDKKGLLIKQSLGNKNDISKGALLLRPVNNSSLKLDDKDGTKAGKRESKSLTITLKNEDIFDRDIKIGSFDDEVTEEGVGAKEEKSEGFKYKDQKYIQFFSTEMMLEWIKNESSGCEGVSVRSKELGKQWIGYKIDEYIKTGDFEYLEEAMGILDVFGKNDLSFVDAVFDKFKEDAFIDKLNELDKVAEIIDNMLKPVVAKMRNVLIVLDFPTSMHENFKQKVEDFIKKVDDFFIDEYLTEWCDSIFDSVNFSFLPLGRVIERIYELDMLDFFYNKKTGEMEIDNGHSTRSTQLGFDWIEFKINHYIQTGDFSAFNDAMSILNVFGERDTLFLNAVFEKLKEEEFIEKLNKLKSVDEFIKIFTPIVVKMTDVFYFYVCGNLAKNGILLKAMGHGFRLKEAYFLENVNGFLSQVCRINNNNVNRVNDLIKLIKDDDIRKELFAWFGEIYKGFFIQV